MDPLEQSGNRDKRNRDRRVTQTTQAGREAQFKAITQKHNSRPLLMQGHHTEPSNRVMKYRRQQKQRNRDKRNRDRRVTQTTQAGREAQFKAITQKHNSRPLLMQGHHTEQSSRVMKYRRQQKQRQESDTKNKNKHRSTIHGHNSIKVVTKGYHAG